MISANQRLVLARELESPHTAQEALKLILADEGFDKSIKDLELTDKDYIQLSTILTTQGPQSVVKEIERIQAVQQEAQRVESVTEAWLTSHPEFVRSEENGNTLRQFMEKEKLPWTKGNLEKAWEASMLAGKLEEAPVSPVRPYFVGQRDPAKVAAGDPVIRKSPANMTAKEFAEATSRSKTFRDKMNEIPTETAPSALTEGERALRAENLKKEANKRELKRTIDQMPSKVYDEWVKNPENRVVVESLYAKA